MYGKALGLFGFTWGLWGLYDNSGEDAFFEGGCVVCSGRCAGPRTGRYQNITTYDDSLYILGSESTYIPFPYILESLYEDDPVLALNEMLDQNVKCLKR